MDEALHAAEQWTEGLLQALRLARALADAQRSVSLDGLANQVGFVCAKAMDLSPEAGRTLRPRLIALLAEVDAVSVALRGQAPHTRQKAGSCSSFPPPS